jgi:hypothetical protein
MTTIILTIIGILLAAAAALMVIFYGGDAFNAGSIGAQANTYQNAGTNVISAVQLAKADNDFDPAGDLDDLAPKYLAEVPALPNGSTPALTANVFTAGVISANAAEVCARINTNLRNGLNDTTSGTPVAPAAVASNVKMQCFGTGTTFTFRAVA